jgi:chorismate mutase-like protein
MDIADWRKQIDQLDEQLVSLLNQRASAAVAIGKIKQQNTAPIYEPKREQQVYEHVRGVNAGPLTAAEVQDIFERIMDVMRNKQKVND